METAAARIIRQVELHTNVGLLEIRDSIRSGFTPEEASARVEELLVPAEIANVGPKAFLDAANADFADALKSVDPKLMWKIEREVNAQMQEDQKQGGPPIDDVAARGAVRQRVLTDYAYKQVSASVEKGEDPDPVLNRVLMASVRQTQAQMMVDYPANPC